MSGSNARKTRKKASGAKPCSSTADNCEKYQSLTLIDVTCPVCLSIMIKPVSMPCSHALCMPCFESNVSKSNLACPLCRKRLSVWVRRMTKLNQLINETLWKKIQECFQEQVQARLAGEDDSNNTFTSTLPPRKVSAPGEIKEEYEDQLRKVMEEEEKRKRKEEKASELVASRLQEEERKRLKEMKNERESLSSDDFEFARQLRTSQLNQTLSSIKTKNAKTPRACGTPSIPSRSPPLGPMDLYLGQVTPTTSRRSDLPQSTPFTDIPVRRNKNPQRKISNDFQGFSNSVSSSMPSSPPSPILPFSRHLKDITSRYSSESESEFDSEENILKCRKVERRSHCSQNIENLENNAAKVKSEPSRVERKAPNAPTNIDDEISTLKLVSMAFDNEDKEIDEDSMKKFLEEQKALEERLQQEKQDRIMALQLQKDWTKVNRSKGSEDEYCLRRSGQTTKETLQSPSDVPLPKDNNKESLPSSSTSPSLTNAKVGDKRPKLRQTTLMENLTKRQRRL